MGATSEPLRFLIEQLQRLPGIGAKSAERLAYHLLRVPSAEALRLADAIRGVKEQLRPCRICFNVAVKETCAICDDPERDRGVICVVEQPKDLLAIEESGSYRGLYHVLQGALAPLDGVSVEDLTIRALQRRLSEGGVREVILATNPDFEGEGTAAYLRDRLLESASAPRVTRLARGMPSGGHLEHVSRNIVSDAIEGRREMD